MDTDVRDLLERAAPPGPGIDVTEVLAEAGRRSRRRRRRRHVGTAGGLAALAALGSVVLLARRDDGHSVVAGSPTTPGSVADPARELGACTEDGIDSGSALGVLASAETWLRVMGLGDGVSAAGYSPTSGRTEALPLRVRDVGAGGAVGDIHELTVSIHTSMVPGIAWGLDHAAEVDVALASEGLDEELVAFTVVRPPDGEVFFPGECEYKGLTQPLRARFGDELAAKVASIVGVVGHDAILGLLVPGSVGVDGRAAVTRGPEALGELVLPPRRRRGGRVAGRRDAGVRRERPGAGPVGRLRDRRPPARGHRPGPRVVV